ncbi:Zinc finger, RING-H2-type [Ostreococcus tauri]|uniref:Zinc finger, RING-H2-type n=1 Tax=Ostreococcus tauri TaxID=70448 RepID=A0A090M685_OSTTA|nr:Zinc finger, RING-H2-type [Ostreococcus tauri]CEF99701.1 Zinc finger, RING-H2-type [Ostreococcus tauri]|eukprot:XP_022839979.1 Zinc finger, RING-H2-type [Ostreococcus tauri]
MAEVMTRAPSTPSTPTSRDGSESGTMFAGSPSERAEALAEALRDGLRVRTPTSSTRTPTSGFAFGESDCAICQSPLDRTRPEATANPDKVELATGLACRHVFHQCCLRRCREHDIRKCPTCQAPLPRGFTPESVREERERHRVRDRIIARSRRATDAIRLARARQIANGAAPPGIGAIEEGVRTPGTPGMVSLSQDTGSDAYEGRFHGLPPRAPRFSLEGAGSAARATSSASRSHPYCRSPSGSERDESEDDEFFVMTQ